MKRSYSLLVAITLLMLNNRAFSMSHSGKPSLFMPTGRWEEKDIKQVRAATAAAAAKKPSETRPTLPPLKESQYSEEVYRTHNEWTLGKWERYDIDRRITAKADPVADRANDSKESYPQPPKPFKPNGWKPGEWEKYDTKQVAKALLTQTQTIPKIVIDGPTE